MTDNTTIDHELKCWTEPFYFIKQPGIKRFELRKNDRNYKVGDTVLLREWNPLTEKYTGDTFGPFKIPYILKEGFGMPEGYCIFSIHDGGLLPDVAGDAHTVDWALKHFETKPSYEIDRPQWQDDFDTGGILASAYLSLLKRVEPVGEEPRLTADTDVEGYYGIKCNAVP